MSDPTIPNRTSAIQPQTTSTATSGNPGSITISQSATGESSAAKSLQIPSVTIIPGLAKNINVGDLINFVMRGRSPDGLGLLYMMGQLVKAAVPENMNTGDRVLAKIEKQGQKLFFKILEIQPKNNEMPLQTEAFAKNLNVSAFEKLERQILELLNKLSQFLPDLNLHTHPPIKELTTSVNSLKQDAPQEIKKILEELQKFFLTEKALTSGQDIFTFIKQRFSDQNIKNLKNLLTQLETFVSKQTEAPEQRFFSNIIENLKNIAKEASEKNLSAGAIDKTRRDLEKLLKVLSLEISTESLGKTPKKNYQYFDSLKIISSNIENILKNQDFSKATIEKIIDTINQLQPEAKNLLTNTKLSTDSFRELMQLSNSLEQFVNTVSMLNQLEPILGLMKAPELILFPFLFQGLLSFGEFAIDPNAHRQKKHHKDSNHEEKEEDDKNKAVEKIYRYTASVQLPNLGMIHISSLQEDKTINIQINVEDQEKGSFIMSKIDDLKNELLANGIVLGEMSADAIDISDEIIIGR